MKEFDKMYYFVDESGDPNFYSTKGKLIVGTEGCSPILIMGLMKTKNPSEIRKKVFKLREDILKDNYYKGIPSIENRRNKFYFHGKDDIPEVRQKVFSLIKDLDIKTYFIVARKKEIIFQNKHNSNSEDFYHKMITHLFKNQFLNTKEAIICFEKRGKKNKQNAIKDSIIESIKDYELKNNSILNVKINEPIIQVPSEEPCLDIIDYVNWSIQRAFIRGEDRYLNYIKEKVSLIWDIYDIKNYPNTFYTKNKNPFYITKISPIEAS